MNEDCFQSPHISLNLQSVQQTYWKSFQEKQILGMILIQLHILFYTITSYRQQKQKMFESERKTASFNQLHASHFFYGGKEHFEAFQKMKAVLASDPDLKYDPSFLHQSRANMMTVFAKKMLKFHHYYPLDGSNEVDKLNFFTLGTPLSIHGIMFITTLRNLCDQQQEKMFLEPTLKGEILGCYAQTELAHGSDVQNLLTTATYDSSTQSFIINTPEIGAAKWWIGDLGIYCNHAAVFAQLIINGKKYGVHVFLVPIRDKNTLTTLKGIQAGDIGPKPFFQNKDNGYAIFNNVRIPRRNMLMKYHVVSKEGVYSLQGNEKISYATMLLTRSGIISVLANSLSKIVAIATRYSIVRKQFKNAKGQEVSVFNYQTQQEKVIPRIADAYASKLIAKFVNDLGFFVFEQSKKNNFQRLNEAHILTSGIKAVLSYDVLRGAEILRRSAGGHGFHFYNGMIAIQGQTTTTFTLEGQFTVLLLQVSRYLLKCFSNIQKGKPLDESARYLLKLKQDITTVELKNQQSLKCPYLVQNLLITHSCAKLKAVSQRYGLLLSQGFTLKQIEDHHAGLLLNDAAMAHIYVIIYSNFLKNVEAVTDPKFKAVITKVLTLYGIERIVERAAKFYQSGTLTPEGFASIYRRREALFDELRPESLTLVEAFSYDDNTLMSAIGASNGRPYENLIQWAEKYNTINKKEERDQVIETIKKAKAQLKPRL